MQKRPQMSHSNWVSPRMYFYRHAKVRSKECPWCHCPLSCHKVLGEQTAKAHLRTANYCLTFLNGDVVLASDGKEGAAKLTLWRLNVNFSILHHEGAKIELKNVDILRTQCVWPVPAETNPANILLADSIHELDHFVRSSATIDNGNGDVTATAATVLPLSAAADAGRGSMSTAAVGANVSLSLVMVPLSTEAAGSGEIQALSVAADNVTSKRKQTTAARSHIIQCCGKEEQEQWLCQRKRQS